MKAAPTWKNYALAGGVSDDTTSLTGSAFEGEVEKDWFSCKIDRKGFKQLIKRSDDVALRHFALWLALLVATGVGAYWTWGSWWCVPFFAAYGILYAAADHRDHEFSHGTPFKTRWINDVLFHLCAFMTLREGFYYRWSHTRHHTHTLLVGRDPEIVAKRPPDIIGIASDLFFIKDGLTLIGRLLRNATGDLTEDGKHFVPESERAKVVWASRAYLAIFALVTVACLASGSILPAMFVVLPRFYGGFLSQLFNLSQHAGLDEDVHDHRLNTRTVYLNPVFQLVAGAFDIDPERGRDFGAAIGVDPGVVTRTTRACSVKRPDGTTASRSSPLPTPPTSRSRERPCRHEDPRADVRPSKLYSLPRRSRTMPLY